jgi:hypothetical protein
LGDDAANERGQVGHDHARQIHKAKDQGAKQDETKISFRKSNIDQPLYDQRIEERKPTADNQADKIYDKQPQHGASLSGKPSQLRRHRFPSLLRHVHYLAYFEETGQIFLLCRDFGQHPPSPCYVTASFRRLTFCIFTNLGGAAFQSKRGKAAARSTVAAVVLHEFLHAFREPAFSFAPK